MIMQKVCPRCKQTSLDGNLWCQEIDCPAGNLSSLLVYGNVLGNFQIVRLLRNWQTAALYEAKQGSELFLLKVANPGNESAFKQEAELWQQLARSPDPALPVWQPHGGENTQEPFGLTNFRGRDQLYIVFAFAKGEFLTDYLLNNPQPWHQHVGLFIESLSRGVETINAAGWLALNLTPEMIMVVTDRAGVPQPILFHAGLLWPTDKGLALDQFKKVRVGLIAEYNAPELASANTSQLSERTEVYSLGLLMYEMLAGHPILVPAGSPIATDPIAAALRSEIIPRKDLPQQPIPISMVLAQALDRLPNNRYDSTATFKETLRSIYGASTPKRRGFDLTRRQAAIAVVILLILVLVIVAMLVLSAVRV